MLAILASASAAFTASPLKACDGASRVSRCSEPTMRKFEPKEGWKVREGTKADDKSWGLFEWASNTFGSDSKAPDTGPKLGGGARATRDDDGNWKGDRRIVKDSGKKTANEGAKFNPLDASTW